MVLCATLPFDLTCLELLYQKKKKATVVELCSFVTLVIETAAGYQHLHLP